jgi:hypothetical protein
MRLSRNRFFLYLFVLLVLPLPLYKLIWILSSRKTEGTMYFTGHGNLGSVLGITTYPVIWFKSGKDTIYFNGNLNIPLREGEKVSVLYQRNDPGDAKIRLFSCLWGDTMAYDLAPFIILLIVFFHPDLIPKKSTILIGRGGKIKIE